MLPGNEDACKEIKKLFSKLFPTPALTHEIMGGSTECDIRKCICTYLTSEVRISMDLVYNNLLLEKTIKKFEIGQVASFLLGMLLIQILMSIWKR